MNSYIVRFKEINLSSTEQHDFIFLSRLVAKVASDILHLTIKNREAAVPTQFIKQDFIKNTLGN